MKFSPFMSVPPSATMRMNTLAQEKRARGERVFNLSAGEPMLPTPEPVAAAARQAIAEHKTLYPPAAGIPELRQAASDWMNRAFGCGFSTAETLITCGGKFGVFAALQALLAPGDEVLIPAPYWVSYPAMVHLFGGVPSVVPAAESAGWKITGTDLEKKYSPKSRALILNNGTNPTGVVYRRDELKNILQFAADRDLTVLSDEVYCGLTYEGECVSAASFPEYRDRVVIIQSCSKHFAMTGWRVGVVFGPAGIIKILTMLQSQSTTGTASISQWAAVTAFQLASQITPTIRAAMRQRRDTLIGELNRVFQTNLTAPAAGLYCFVPIKILGRKFSGLTSEEFCERALTDGNVAIVPGSAFGAEGFARLSFAAEEKELIGAVGALGRWAL